MRPCYLKAYSIIQDPYLMKSSGMVLYAHIQFSTCTAIVVKVSTFVNGTVC